MKRSKPKGPSPSRKNTRPDEDRVERLNALRARWGKAPLKDSALTIDSCEVEIGREERKLGTALRMRGAAAWGLHQGVTWNLKQRETELRAA